MASDTGVNAFCRSGSSSLALRSLSWSQQLQGNSSRLFRLTIRSRRTAAPSLNSSVSQTKIMRPIATIILAFAMGAAAVTAQAKDAITLSLSPSTTDLNFGESLTINVAVTNSSTTPRYLDRNVIGPLQYSVKTTPPRILFCDISDPPPPLPKPQGEEDWVWLQPGKTMHFTQRLSQKDLCMSVPGTYYVSALLIGYIATEAQRKSRALDVFSSWSNPISVVIHAH